MTITGFVGVYSDGTEAKIDAQGNNVAFSCNKCGHPVLAIAREHQRGYSSNNPAICQGCNEQYFIEVREKTEKIIINNVEEL